jgi:predicted esterase
MRKFFNARKTHAFVSIVTLWLLIADFAPMLAPYSVGQFARQVPYGYRTKFWAYTPIGYSDTGPGYPLLISLHGGSAIGNDLEMLFEPTHENPPQLIHINDWFDLPFIVVSPQLRRDTAFQHYNEQSWPDDLVDEVLEYVKHEYNVDSTRIYITGISLGAAGAWCYSIAHPEKVAAIVPMGGQSFEENACAIEDVGVWAFHGENDVFVPTFFTPRMVDAINECSPPSRYRAHANVAVSMQHEVWDEVFNMTGGYDVYKWMLSFKKGDTANLAPFVFGGVDRKIRIPQDHFYLTGEYFDSDGLIDTIYWSQNDGPKNLTLEQDGPRFLKVSNATEAGTYTFRLTVKDDRGATSFDDVSITLTATSESHAALALTLTDQTGTKELRTLSNGTVFRSKGCGWNY